MQLTYYHDDGPAWSWWGHPPAGEEPDQPTEDGHSIRWGYNLADLESLARLAVRRAFGGVLPHRDRYEAAWSAIAETLCTAEDRPDPADLIRAGWSAVNHLINAEARTHGIRPDRAWSPSGEYERYWRHTTRPTPSPEARVVDRTALWQIWPLLTPRQRQALTLLAGADDQHMAAQAMGATPTYYRVLVSQARARFLRAWHEGEQPSKPWRAGRRIGHRSGLDRYGKPRITRSQLEQIRDRHHAGETLTAIGADYGVGKGCLSALLTGRTRPAPDAEETCI